MLALLGIHQHLSAEQKQDIASAAYHATPGAVTAGGFRLAGLPLSDWLVLASIAFVALQASYLIWKWRRDYLRAQNRQQLRERAQQRGRP
ncbi:Phage holin T7 family, holin superfamily II [Comamonas aquatilis]